MLLLVGKEKVLDRRVEVENVDIVEREEMVDDVEDGLESRAVLVLVDEVTKLVLKPMLVVGDDDVLLPLEVLVLLLMGPADDVEDPTADTKVMLVLADNVRVVEAERGDEVVDPAELVMVETVVAGARLEVVLVLVESRDVEVANGPVELDVVAGTLDDEEEVATVELVERDEEVLLLELDKVPTVELTLVNVIEDSVETVERIELVKVIVLNVVD